MAKLDCTYLGLELKNPVIVGSSGLTSSVEKLKRLEEEGAGAVVLHSVFEEQITNETASLENYNDSTEAADYLFEYLSEDYIDRYISLVAEAKKTLSIPVIGSINCVSAGEWTGYAGRIEAAGADALELNVFLLPTDRRQKSEQIEQSYLEIIGRVVETVKIPVAVKIGFRFTNLLAMVDGIEANGARGVVMFNRFYEPDINIDSVAVAESDVFSTSSELRNSIRWIAMSSAQFPHLDIAASTGIHNGADAVKVLLAGASAFEICSVIYEKGLGAINEINGFIEKWMSRKGFESLDEFRGRLNYGNVANPDTLAFERSQFMRHFTFRK